MKLVAVSYLQVPGESPGFLTRSAMMRELSIFVDESGDRNANSRYYLLTLVFHEQAEDIRANTQNMCLFPGVSGWFSVLPSLCGCVGIRLGIWGCSRWLCPIVSGLVLVV